MHLFWKGHFNDDNHMIRCMIQNSCFTVFSFRTFNFSRANWSDLASILTKITPPYCVIIDFFQNSNLTLQYWRENSWQLAEQKNKLKFIYIGPQYGDYIRIRVTSHARAFFVFFLVNWLSITKWNTVFTQPFSLT